MEKMEADKNGRKLLEAAKNLEPVLYPSSCYLISQFMLFKMFSIPRYTIVCINFYFFYSQPISI